MNKRLNTNFSRNDYDSCRDIKVQPSVISLSSVAGTVIHYSASIDDFPLANAKAALYEQYKMTNCQAVLTPLFVNTTWDNHQGVTGIYEAFGAIWPRADVPVPTTLPTWSDVKKSPGVRLFKINSTKRIVLNLVPQVETNIQTEQGLNLRSHRKLGWTEYRTPAIENVDVCPYTVNLPQIAAGTGNKISWKVEMYATFVFRGLKALIPE